jgi:gliding motility-associated-like protein
MNVFRILLLFALVLLCSPRLLAEGSRDLVAAKGYRVFYNAQQRQQLKVYAASGEFIHVGASHVGVSGGYIRVVRPNGSLHTIFNNAGQQAGKAIIHNRTQEFAGPNGGGSVNGPGYDPGIISVQPGEEGVWTILLEYPAYSVSAFANVLNTADWTRANDQPTNQRVVLAWDVTVSKALPVNQGGIPLTGRLFTQEFIALVNDNGNLTDVGFYVLTNEGMQYRVYLEDMDPWGWFVSGNNRGVVDHQQIPLYRSMLNTDYIRSWQPDNWQAGMFYQYEPQTRDIPFISNHKLFFNLPDPALPKQGLTYDYYRLFTHQTWLNPDIPDYSLPLYDVDFSALKGPDSIYSLCGDKVMAAGVGGYITFRTVGWGQLTLRLDIDQNGSFNDPADVLLTKTVGGGADSIFWNGLNGLGAIVPPQKDFPLRLRFSGTLYSGEMHFQLFDVENMVGGIAISRLNGQNPGPVAYYFDHSAVGGQVSGGGTPGNPLPATGQFGFGNGLGDEKLLDFWSYVSIDTLNLNVTILIDIVDGCYDPDLDSDGDGIIDVYDLDDDNDGIPDYMEYCGASGFWCLPGGLDPSGDEDKDKIPNYRDADDPAFDNPCEDLDGDGICDRVAAIYDHDGDGVPNHLDLDSDNDGISDLFEAKHGAPDLTRNGRIDAPWADFGDNGFYNPLANKPNGQDAVANYLLPDRDADGFTDNLDLDSDNDGIHDVAENGLQQYDSNGDGRLDDGNGQPSTDAVGIPQPLSPTLSGQPLPFLLDTDGDGVPDQNDLDADNDGLLDVTEALRADSDGDGIIGTGKPVVDGAGRPVTDALGQVLFPTSSPVNTDGLERPDFQDLDSDEDDIWDAYEAGVYDPDYDGIAGSGIPVVDAFGVPQFDAGGDPLFPVLSPPDFDGDGLPDYRDPDSDNDGISDGYECYDYKNGLIDLPCLDTDGDGIPDIFDNDSDNDGLSDTQECPAGNNPECPDSSGNGVDDFRDPNLFFNEDTDGDGIPNTADLDNDNDGIPDDMEFCPDRGFACLPGGVHPDGDEDGDLIPNFMDADDPAVNNPCQDANGDGICDRVHPVYDYDGDGVANHNDLDADNDGIPDLYEAGHDAPDDNGNGMIDGPPAVFGQNGLYNPISTHPDALTATITYTLRDSDGDQVHDFRDLDADNDGIHDVAENGFQQWDSNNDGRIDNGSGLPDVGWMGIPRVVNPLWTGVPMQPPGDADGDGVPNFQDLDSDNDGIHDVTEQKTTDPDGDGRIGTAPITVDTNGRPLTDATGVVLSATSLLVDTDADGRPDFRDLDADGDGIPDVLEAQLPDPDQDGWHGLSPLIVNVHGVPVQDAAGNALASISNPRDLDGDGMPDFQDIDRDGDGIRDGYECWTPYACVDTDGDGMPDVDDLNSDGDCETDMEECPGGDPCPDSSGNGIPDFRQFDCCPPFEPVLTGAGDTLQACSSRPLVLTAQNANPSTGAVTYTWIGPGLNFTNTVSGQSPLNAPLTPSMGSSGVYTLSAVSAQGCKGADLTLQLNVVPTPAQPGLQVDPQEICEGDELILSTQLYTGSGVSYQWQFTPFGGSTVILGETGEPVFLVPDAGQNSNGAYSVIVTVAGCVSDGAGQVLVSVLPPADIQAGDDSFTLLLEDEVLEGNVLLNDLFNTGSVVISVVQAPERGQLLLLANGQFRYTAEPGYRGVVYFDYQICGELCDRECDTARVTIVISVQNIPEDCGVYNILTPNNDGANDFLEIPCLYRYPEHELRVYNRWGDEVYHTTDYKQDWAGEWRGNPLPAGTYFYFLRVFGENAQEIQGYITIIR